MLVHIGVISCYCG